MSSVIGFKINKITATVLLVLYGNAVFLSPLALAVDHVGKYKQVKLLPYTIVEGDTLYSLAKKNSLTVDELILINKDSPEPIVSAEEIKSGQVIYFPEKNVTFNLPDLGDVKTKSSKVIDNKTIAQNLNRVGNQYSTEKESSQYSSYIKSISGGNNSDTYSDWLVNNSVNNGDSTKTPSTNVVDGEIKYWKQQGLSLVESQAENILNDQFKRFGSAEIEINLNENFEVDDYGVDFLAPLVDVDNQLFFSQIGVHHQKFNDHTTVNMGIGQRHFFERWMFGYNAFWDVLLSNEKSPGHQRLGLGIESWADNLKFTTNYYFPLSDWKDSLILNNYEERAAKGFDIQAAYYLKKYPQLGLNAKYEQYFGDEVDLLNNGNRLHNPSAASLGVEWQPLPLISLNVDHTWAASQQDNTLATLNFNWQIGASFSEMFESENVAKTRNLQGMRYDSVERNNNIVLEYKEKARIVSVKHLPIVGFSGQMITLNPTVSISNGNIVKYHWMSPDPLLSRSLNNIYSKNANLTLPQIALEFINSGVDFPLYLKVEDEKGNIYESDKIPVKVTIDSNRVVERIFSLTPEIEVDSIDKPDVSIENFPKSFVLEWVFIIHDKSDSTNWDFYKPNDIELKKLQLFDVERLPGRYAEYSYSHSESKKIWIEKLKFTVKDGISIPNLFHEKFTLSTVGPSNRSSSISLDIALNNRSVSPQITDLRLAGKLEVGQSLSATYGFNANGGDSNDKSTYVWGNKGDTAATVAAGASVTTSGQVPAVSLTAADIGEIKEVSVQAKNGLAITGNTLTVNSSQGAGNGDDTTGGGNGGEVLDPNNIQVAIHYTSSATILANGTNGGAYTGTENIRAVANVDEMRAMCQILGESSMSPCDTRFNLNWYVNGRIVPGAVNHKFTPVATDQGLPVAVEATLKP
ncbi:inverse autotransporter beta domain-containing protein [Shewanella xiamenensis]|uniref:inverse autotransporter beta domain-containing protein n=1 Tax=Shewanella xiamenensis TaxID=332186 RepID=UPI0035B8BD20